MNLKGIIQHFGKFAVSLVPIVIWLLTFPVIIPLIMKSLFCFFLTQAAVVKSPTKWWWKEHVTHKIHNPTTPKHPGGQVVTCTIATTWNNDGLLERRFHDKCTADFIAAGQTDCRSMVEFVEDGDDHFLTNQDSELQKQASNRGTVALCPTFFSRKSVWVLPSCVVM